MRTAAIASAVLVATSLTALALTTWYGQTAPVADKRRRDNDAQSSGGLFDSWFGWLDPFQEEVQTEYEQHPNGLTSVGPWKAGDPWPGGYECTKGQSDAFHMKPDKGCEPDCEQCQMVCIPSAFLGPFKNHGGEVGGNCFERGCLQPAGEGKRSGVTYFMFDCDKALLQEWTEKQKAASESPEVVAETNRTTCIAKCSKRDKDCLKDCETKFMMALGLSAQQAAQQQKSLQECLDECGKRDKDCQIKCEETHKEVRATPHRAITRRAARVRARPLRRASRPLARSASAHRARPSPCRAVTSAGAGQLDDCQAQGGGRAGRARRRGADRHGDGHCDVRGDHTRAARLLLHTQQAHEG